jgi:hypothetical protein
MYFGDAVREGRIKAYVRRALTATVHETKETRLAVHFGLPAT